MTRWLLAISMVSLVAGCSDSGRGRNPNGGGSNGNGGVGGGGMGNIPGCDPSNNQPSDDKDHDGYTVSAGDCNDCNPSINPGAIQIPNDPTDYSCNGQPGVVPSCSPMNRANDPTSLAQAMDQCDPRFFKGAMLLGPSDAKARKVLGNFGILMPRAGSNFTLISSGIAGDKNDPDFDKMNEEDPGTDFGSGNTAPHPYPNIMPNPMCSGAMGAMSSEPGTVNDYVELVLKLKAPTNVNSFSFDFQFFSAEYPVYVCTEFNDEFLVLQESNGEFQQATNIAFDMQKNPVTVNNGFFTVCTNDTSKPYTQHCTQPVSDINGTGFEDSPGGGISIPGLPVPGNIPGGSTGWLTTTSPVTPGEDVVLHFIIFDEGDHILDSAALIDNFRWGTSVVSGPSTNPIQ
jgi:hypothetical protein